MTGEPKNEHKGADPQVTAPPPPNAWREKREDPWTGDLVCPKCSHAARVSVDEPAHWGESHPVATGTFCPRSSCRAPIFVAIWYYDSFSARFETVWPQAIKVPKYRVPAAVLADYREASSSFANGNWTATLVMSRKTLERVLVDQGATNTDRLDEMIDFLCKEKQLISPRVAEAAKQVKSWGSLGHIAKEGGKRPDRDDAEASMEVLDGILSQVYEFGENLKDSNDKRAARSRS